MKTAKQSMNSMNPDIMRALGSQTPVAVDAALPPPKEDPFKTQLLLGQADPVQSYISGGGKETFEDFQKKYESAMSPEQFGFGGVETLGMDPVASGAIKRAQSRRLQQSLGDIRGSMMRGAFGDYADRLQNYQQVVSARQRNLLSEQQRMEAEKAAQRARQRSLLAGLGSIAGGVGGFLVGGPAGAMIGSGIGGLAGSGR